MPTVQEQAASAIAGQNATLGLIKVDSQSAAALAARLASLGLLRADLPAADLATTVATAIHQAYCTQATPHVPNDDDLRLARAILPIVQKSICRT